MSASSAPSDADRPSGPAAERAASRAAALAAALPRFSQDPRDPAFAEDPWPAYARLRALGPAAWWEELSLPVLHDHAPVAAALRDRRLGRDIFHVASREALGLPPIPARLQPFYAFDSHSLLEREPPDHTRIRALVARAFTSRATAGLGPRIEALANGLLDTALDGALESGAPFDLIDAYAAPIPLTVIAELLGVPLEDAPRMLGWSHDMVAMYQAGRTRADEDRALRATAEFSAYMEALIARRRRAPGEALIDALIAAEGEEGRLSPPELVTTCILLMNAGHEATVHAIGDAARLVLERDAPRDLFAGPMAEAAVEECLRLEPPLHLFTRWVLEDVEIAGLSLRLGDRVGLLLGAAGRDPAAFPDPDRFDPARPRPAAHLAFGGGIHFCVGAALARLEMRIALKVLFARAPGLRLADPPRRGLRWHFHGHESLPVAPR